MSNLKLDAKTLLFQTIQFSISTQFSSIWPINRALSGNTTPGLSWLKSNGSEGVLYISKSSNIIGISPSDGLVSNPGYPWGVVPIRREATRQTYRGDFFHVVYICVEPATVFG